MAEEKQRLGRGLAALIGDSDVASIAPDRYRGTRKVAVHLLLPNPMNPRKKFETTALHELADSIRQKGVLQPITVRVKPTSTSEFEIIAGERRFRASLIAGLHEVPVHVIEASTAELLELAMIENLQRQDLNPIEEARGYQTLIDQLGYSHQDIANFINKSRSHITNMLRLLALPENVQQMVAEAEITKSHARAIAASPNPEQAARMLVQGSTVREAEEAIRQLDKVGTAVHKLTSRSKDPNITDVERRLGEHLGLRVAIKAKGEGGELSLKYASLEQLENILRLLERQ